MPILLILLPQLLQANQRWEIESGFQPQTLRVGEQGAYHFTLTTEDVDAGHGMGMQSPEVNFSGIPNVDGLRIEYLGPSRNFQMINRQVSLSLAYQFRVIATRSGTFTLPAFGITVNGREITVPESTLRVIERTADHADSEDAWVWLEYVLPRESIYVGEAVPVRVQLSVRDGAHVRLAMPHPEKTGDAFMTGPFSDAGQTRRHEDGRVIHQVSWEVLITPIRAGTHELGFEQVVLMTLPEERDSRRRDRFGGFFGPSLFDQLTRQQQVSVITPENELNVLPLPATGKPQHFTGAIGNFEVEAPSLRGVEVREGEPMSLTIRISGSGNFGSFSPPALLSDDDWREYPGIEPFRPQDQIGWRGQQVIEYTLIPRNSDITQTPRIDFNFFNPETGNYVELPVPPQDITVLPAPPGQQRTTSRPPVAGQPDLLPIALSPGSWSGSMRPVFFSPLFYAAQVIPLTALLALALTRRHQLRLRNDPRYARLLQSRARMADCLKQATEAARKGSPKTFQAHAERALREAFSPMLDGPADGLTLAEMESLLNGLSVEASLINNLRDFFETGSAVRFSGSETTADNLAERLQALEMLLQRLKSLQPKNK